MNMKNSNKRSTEWVKRLPAVVSALNNEVTRLIGTLKQSKRNPFTPNPPHPTRDRLVERKNAPSPSQCEIFVSTW